MAYKTHALILGFLLLGAFIFSGAWAWAWGKEVISVEEALKGYLAIREREIELASSDPSLAHRAAIRWLREANLPESSVLMKVLPGRKKLREEAFALLEDLLKVGYLPAGRTLFFHLYLLDREKALDFLPRLCQMDRGNVYGFCYLMNSSPPEPERLQTTPQALLTLGRAIELGYFPGGLARARKYFLLAYHLGLEEGASALARTYLREAKGKKFVCSLPESSTYQEFLLHKKQAREIPLKKAIRWYRATTRTYEKLYRIVRLNALLKERPLSVQEKLFFASRGVTLAWRDLVPPGKRGPSPETGIPSLTRKALECEMAGKCSVEEARALLLKACYEGERSAEVALADFLADPFYRFEVYRYHALKGNAAALSRLVSWLLEKGHPEEARRWLEWGKRWGMPSERLYLMQSELLLRQGRTEEALDLLKKLFQSGSCRALEQLFRLFPEEALKLTIPDNCFLPPELIGRAYLKSGNLKKALFYFLKVPAKERTPRLKKTIGGLYFRLGEAEKAKKWLLRAAKEGEPLNRREKMFLAEELFRLGIKDGTIYMGLALRSKGLKALCCAFLAAKEGEPGAVFFLVRTLWRNPELQVGLQKILKKDACECLPR